MASSRISRLAVAERGHERGHRGQVAQLAQRAHDLQPHLGARDRARARPAGVTASRRRLLPELGGRLLARARRWGSSGWRPGPRRTGVAASDRPARRSEHRTRTSAVIRSPASSAIGTSGEVPRAPDGIIAETCRPGPSRRPAGPAPSAPRAGSGAVRPASARGQRLGRALEDAGARPPRRPPGPRSITQSACFTTSMLCSMTSSVAPASSRRWKHASSSLMSPMCRPVVGSSRT